MSQDPASLAFELLHQRVRRWVWRQQWAELRVIQEQAIPLLVKGERDVIISAGTASGKTEAAFLPIVSRLASDDSPAGGGFQALYVSPLRALINDQFGRMEGLCEEVDLPVTKWHGDVAASAKERARKRPHGIVLITPESVEALLVRRGNEATRLFASLRYVVVDEMHAFMGDERGRQLQSLLHRLEIAAGHPVVRVGLSATLADTERAKAFLRPLDPDRVSIVDPAGVTQVLRLQVRGYIQPVRRERGGPGLEGEEEPENHAQLRIARDLFEIMRGHRGLVFAGSRQKVEQFTVYLREGCEELGLPEEFFAHHGSLSREHREDAERRLKDESRPGTIIATTTLELGIDVGSIESVAQLGAGHSVSGMRQRLGRSGRCPGKASTMRIYVTETEVDERTHQIDELRFSTVKSVAMVNLMLRKWNEPQVQGRLHLSTLVHQVLALIAQHGGLTAKQGWERLAVSGVFPCLDRDLYVAVLRRMAHSDVKLIEQAPDGTLLPGAEGERVIADRSFYAVFEGTEEFRVITDRGRTLGGLPVTNPIVPAQLLIFAGRRWRVLEVDPKRREILVTAASGGHPPPFDGGVAPSADAVVAEMRRVYESSTVPVFLDETASQLLAEGQATFLRLGLHQSRFTRHNGDLLLFPWVGGRAQTAFMFALKSRDVDAAAHGVAIEVTAIQEAKLRAALGAIANEPPPDAVALARRVPDMRRSKFDGYLGDDLLSRCYASEFIDAGRVPVIARDLAAGMGIVTAGGADACS